MYIYIYIHIYIYVFVFVSVYIYVFVCVSIYIYMYVFMCVYVYTHISKWIGPLRDLHFFRIIHFVLTFVYIFSLLLSSKKICCTRSYEWGTQSDLN